jgi:DNA-binding PadR family transcriptional regulator
VIYLIYGRTIDWRVIGLDNSTPLTEALFYILLALRRPNHGYGIIQDVSEMTAGRVTLGPGTLYGAINSMLTKGWISLYSEDKESRKKKEYLITSTGKQIFQNEVKRLNELVQNAKKMED